MRGPGLLVLVASVLIATAVDLQLIGKSRGDLTGCKANFKNIGCALEMYTVDHHGHYPASLDDLTPLYLKRLPRCPAAGYSTYKVSFGRQAPLNEERSEQYYLLQCAGEAHKRVGVGPDFSKWASHRGLLEPSDVPNFIP